MWCYENIQLEVEKGGSKRVCVWERTGVSDMSGGENRNNSSFFFFFPYHIWGNFSWNKPFDLGLRNLSTSFPSSFQKSNQCLLFTVLTSFKVFSLKHNTELTHWKCRTLASPVISNAPSRKMYAITLTMLSSATISTTSHVSIHQAAGP